MKSYLCIDLKSFYASVECVERGLDPMTTDLVVADEERGPGTICLAVSPSLKAKGVRNRCRLFEIPKHYQYIIARPRMKKYIDYAARIYGVYLSYLSKDDIYVYSIDEAFLDVTTYLKMYQRTPRQMAEFLMNEVFTRVGVRATAGVGTNLYLAKVALDIIAKSAPDFIGELDEESYQRTLWTHRPLTDFWRIGPGISRNLAKHQMFTMGDVARADEDILYGIFGKNAELLIDHAWGREPVTIADIKAAVPREHSYSIGQVLPREYSAEETLLAAREMARDLCLRLTAEKQTMNSLSLTLGSRDLPHGTVRFDRPTSSVSIVLPKLDDLFNKIAIPGEKYRRLYLNANKVQPVSIAPVQLSLFDNSALLTEKHDQKIQAAILDIQRKYGKAAILRGEDLEPSSTARWRSGLIGGHRSGVENNGKESRHA